MKKIEPTIIKETLYILVCVVILSAIMESVFLIIHRWDYTVLLGNLLTGFAVTLNFVLMGLGVQKSLEKLAEGRTTFTIAHRLTTIRNADRILVLTEDGIEESGTHQALMEKGGIYSELYALYSTL